MTIRLIWDQAGLALSALALGAFATACDAAGDGGGFNSAALAGDAGQAAQIPWPGDAGSVSQAGAAPTPAGGASGSAPLAGDGGSWGPPSGGTAGGRSQATSSTEGGGLPCQVKAIVNGKCGTCHGVSPSFGAPMSLTTAAQFQAAGASDKTKKVYELAKNRVNASTASVKMPPTTSMQLTADELSALNAWLQQGAPSSTETCQTAAGVDAGVTTPVDKSQYQCHKFLAHADGNMASPYPVGAAVDSYITFGFKSPFPGTTYGEYFEPVIGNPQAIHHWLLYEEPTQDGSISPSIGQHAQGRLLAGWAPGGPPYNFKDYGDVGFELNGTSFVLEVHYNSANPSATDASGVEICVQTKKPTNVAGMTWLGYDQGAVISATTGVCNPAVTWTGTCRPQSTQPIHILFVTPHLHQTGRHLKAVIDGPNGQRILHDAAFDFNYQITYKSQDVLMPGETITTTCTFSEPQCFGQATSAEMCYLFTYSWPKGALADGKDWGALAHGEGTCLGQSTLDIF
jgi:hypothetical protein